MDRVGRWRCWLWFCLCCVCVVFSMVCMKEENFVSIV